MKHTDYQGTQNWSKTSVGNKSSLQQQCDQLNQTIKYHNKAHDIKQWQVICRTWQKKGVEMTDELHM